MGKKEIGGPVAITIVVIVVIAAVAIGIYEMNKPQQLTGVAAQRSVNSMQQQEQSHANAAANPPPAGTGTPAANPPSTGAAAPAAPAAH